MLVPVTNTEDMVSKFVMDQTLYLAEQLWVELVSKRCHLHTIQEQCAAYQIFIYHFVSVVSTIAVLNFSEKHQNIFAFQIIP